MTAQRKYTSADDSSQNDFIKKLEEAFVSSSKRDLIISKQSTLIDASLDAESQLTSNVGIKISKEITQKAEESAAAILDAIIESNKTVNRIEGVDSFQVLKRCEGCVLAVSDSTLTAEVIDMDTESPVKEVIEVDLTDISPQDLPLVTVGSIFYWHVGYNNHEGTIMRGSVFRFRRLPAWSRSEINKSKEYAKKIRGLFES